MALCPIPNSVFLCCGKHLSDIHDKDAIWVTAFFLKNIIPADSDEYIMQYVLDQIKTGQVIVGTRSISRIRTRCISLALPISRVARYIPGVLAHAQVLAGWWLQQIREGTIQLDREHIFRP